MLTEAELTALQDTVSNSARALYCVLLRPYSNPRTYITAPINYATCIQFLNNVPNQPESETAYQRGRDINHLIAELIDVGLVTLPNHIAITESIHGVCLSLPLAKPQSAFDNLHSQRQTISLSWQPDVALFKQLSTLIGLNDTTYSQEEVGEFISFWLTRPNVVFSQFQWTQKFTYNIKQKRLSTGSVSALSRPPKSVAVAPAVDADDNAQKLVAKYSSKSQN